MKLYHNIYIGILDTKSHYNTMRSNTRHNYDITMRRDTRHIITKYANILNTL